MVRRVPLISMSEAPHQLVLSGGTLINGTGSKPVEDSVIVIEEGYISKVAKQGEIKPPEKAEVYDTSGMTLLPGFIDNHVHFLNLGVSMLRTLNLSDAPSIHKIVEMVEERAEKYREGEWIIGRGWDEAKWEEQRYLSKYDLDPITERNPVLLTRVCGHLLTLNSKALELAKITRKTSDPPGGQIDKDEDGDPTGILRDCRHLVEHLLPMVTEEMKVEGLKLASEYALSLGCTSVGDAGVDLEGLKAYQSAYRKGFLNVRAYLMLSKELHEPYYASGIPFGFGNSMIRIGPIKLFIDGSLGARTAALFEPYSDEPTTNGLLLTKPDEMTEMIKKAHVNNWQAAVHAIGDRGIEHAINSIQEALKMKPGKNHRHRIEHCEVLTSQQVERLKQLNIIAAMQPNFIGEWGGPEGMYESRLGPYRERNTNPYRALLDEEVILCFGSDGVPFNPLYGIHSAVNHPHKHNRITLEEAVKCYTLNSAYASFEEHLKGSIVEGKLADITVLDRELTKIPSSEIREAKVHMTLLEGKILYSTI
jgi:predicted amidohydrolase YtcJ